ncbi:MAG: hypothetical protein HYW22_00080 [Candidatus Aenigmarchaeota archaeon]|nr:hypothetical protein [Candidatus Aenigmarchaeota archaeon]
MKIEIKAVFQHNYNVKYSREGKWIIAEIPGLNLATHGDNLKQVQDNLKDLIKDYMEDPDTPKPIHKIKINFGQISSGVLHNVQAQAPVKA